jgi:outer membrane protein OmpA-like peptidoglycan-associated protein
MKGQAFSFMLSLALISTGAVAQAPSAGAGPPYRGRLLSFAAETGFAIYHGEFSDGSLAALIGFRLATTVIPELTAGAEARFVDLSYYRASSTDFAESYLRQFGTAPDATRTTRVSAIELAMRFHAFPRSMISPFALLGAGLLFYTPVDYAQNAVAIRPRHDHTNSVFIPVGIGVEAALFRDFTISITARTDFLFVSDLDGFDPALIAGSSTGSASTRNARDGFSTLTCGVQYFPFRSDDYDRDLLSNAVEDSIGTNRYLADTDNDALSDYEEVVLLHTDPTMDDTDRDGLGDFAETFRTRTDPLHPDSDRDGLTDSDEAIRYRTDPNNQDTDDDLLTDFEEIMYVRTDPLNPDTDCDGLTDYTEVRIHLTNPRNEDTDSDGLVDFAEVIALRTNPNAADSDRDSLTDFEEVYYFATNPLITDSDDDGLSDAYELLTTMTNPLRRDSDDDGLPDNIDPEPLFGTRSGSPSPAIAVRASAAGINTTALRKGKTFAFLNVTFDFGKFEIRKESVSTIDEIARVFYDYPGMSVEIRGHTDFEGTQLFNQTLSENRARAVRDYLLRLGVRASRMKTAGFGERFPLRRCESEDCKAMNRRVEFRVDEIDNAPLGETPDE